MAQLDQLPKAASSGWIAGRRDGRDFTLLRKTPLAQRVYDSLQRRVKAITGQREHMLNLDAFGQVRNQRSLNACCAFAGVSLMEYRVRRDRELPNTECSPGFLYKVTRDLMKKDGEPNTDGNVPTDSRTTMKAMTFVGVAPEKTFPTNEADVDLQPDLLTYALAGNFKATSYWRVDVDVQGRDLLKEVKQMLLADLPLMFTVRFFVKDTLQAFAIETGRLPQFPPASPEQISALRTREAVEALLIPRGRVARASASAGAAPLDPQARARDTMLAVQRALRLPQAGQPARPLPPASKPGSALRPPENVVGHALVACGFDDDKQALLVRNSWSDEWAPIERLPGYGWLPYDYVLKGLTEDWWFISDASFVDPSIFGAAPQLNAGA